jgi:hypothetical protein
MPFKGRSRPNVRFFPKNSHSETPFRLVWNVCFRPEADIHLATYKSILLD